MRKLISILMALGLILSFSLIATPAAAVEEPVDVYLANETACDPDDYTVVFHNVGTLIADDFIDIMFETGTNTSTLNASCCKVFKHSLSRAAVTPSPYGYLGATYVPAKYAVTAVPANAAKIGSANRTVRFTLTGEGTVIEKCDYVAVVVCNVTNPTSCNYHLEVGTSAHTPVDSEPFTIYCAKVALVGGPPDPDTGLELMNLVSLPCYPDDESIEVVLAELFDEVDETAGTSKPFTFSVWYWDNDSDTWLKYVSDSSFTDLETIEPGKAYWIKPSAAIEIKIHGDPYPPGQGPPLKWCYPRCWNMVGFASLVSMNASTYLKYTKIGMGYTEEAVLAIWDFDEDNQVYDDLGWTGTDPDLTPGQGYWMAFVDEACIIPPPQSSVC